MVPFWLLTKLLIWALSMLPQLSTRTLLSFIDAPMNHLSLPDLFFCMDTHTRRPFPFSFHTLPLGSQTTHTGTHSRT